MCADGNSASGVTQCVAMVPVGGDTTSLSSDGRRSLWVAASGTVTYIREVNSVHAG